MELKKQQKKQQRWEPKTDFLTKQRRIIGLQGKDLPSMGIWPDLFQFWKSRVSAEGVRNKVKQEKEIHHKRRDGHRDRRKVSRQCVH